MLSAEYTFTYGPFSIDGLQRWLTKCLSAAHSTVFAWPSYKEGAAKPAQLP